MKTRLAQSAAGARKKVFIVDDHPITRYGLAQLIKREPDLVVCAEAENAQQALGALRAAEPDLILADITMPGKSGLDFIRELQALYPQVPTLVMSMHDERIYAERAIRAGARGYIMKSEGGEKLLGAVRHVLQGQIYLSNRMATMILCALGRRHAPPGESGPSLLSDREFEVFQLLGEGLSTNEIAKRLHLSAKTVGTHRTHIKEKLKLRTGSELIRQAVRWGATQQLL